MNGTVNSPSQDGACSQSKQRQIMTGKGAVGTVLRAPLTGMQLYLCILQVAVVTLHFTNMELDISPEPGTLTSFSTK